MAEDQIPEYEDEQMHGGYYAMVPAQVYLCRELEPGAALLYGVLNGLCNRNGHAWVKNQWLAAHFGTTIRCVQQWLTSLESKNFIFIELCETPHGTRRKIMTYESASRPETVRQMIGGVKKPSGGGEENFMGECKNFHVDLLSFQTADNNSKILKEDTLSKERERASAPPSKEAVELADLLLQKIRVADPQAKAGKDWAIHIDRIIRLDKRSPDNIRDLIEWATSHSFWSTVILSGSGLRKNFQKAFIQMMQSEAKAYREINKTKAKALIGRYPGTYRGAKLTEAGVVNPSTGELIPFDLDEAQFDSDMLNAFQTGAGYGR